MSEPKWTEPAVIPPDVMNRAMSNLFWAIGQSAVVASHACNRHEKEAWKVVEKLTSVAVELALR